MKETGMLFTSPMVRAILEGRKTQTRRIVKPAPETDQRLQTITTETGLVYARSMEKIDYPNLRRIRWQSPVGQPGDRIYVRETFVQGYKADPETGAVRDYDEEGNDIPMTTWYRATDGGITWCDDDGWETNVPWKPAIHMPKALARIWLEITGVRVERLQEITPDNCIAEGAWPVEQRELGRGHEAVSAFRELWESTGGDWAANPWVWVIDFKVLSTTGKPSQADG